jgi:beta-glucosidase
VSPLSSGREHPSRPLRGAAADASAAILVEFGARDDAVADVLLDAAHAQGRLPFDLPSSMKAVAESRSDVPYDTADPLFRFGDGIVSS